MWATHLKIKKMKKVFFTAILSIGVLSVSFAQDQVYRVMNSYNTLDTNDDTEIEEGYVFTSNSVEEADGLWFLTYNDSGEPIYMQIECTGVSTAGNDASGMQVCYGLCITNIQVNEYIPGYSVLIPPGSHQGFTTDHFIHHEETDEVIEYEFRFFQLDEDGFDVENSNLNITYIYDKDAMGVSDVNSISIAKVYPTVVKNSTTVELKENAQVQIVNLEGKLVKTTSLNAGKSTLDMTGIAPGVYWIKFKGVSGTSTMKKVVVK